MKLQIWKMVMPRRQGVGWAACLTIVAVCVAFPVFDDDKGTDDVRGLLN